MTFVEALVQTSRALILSWDNFDKLYWYRLKTAVKTLLAGIWFLIAPFLILLAPLLAIAVYFSTKKDEKNMNEQINELNKRKVNYNMWK